MTHRAEPALCCTDETALLDGWATDGTACGFCVAATVCPCVVFGQAAALQGEDFGACCALDLVLGGGVAPCHRAVQAHRVRVEGGYAVDSCSLAERCVEQWLCPACALSQTVMMLRQRPRTRAPLGQKMTREGGGGARGG
jgi:hypothetical protein